MTSNDKAELYREAALILVALNDDPEDRVALDARDAFIARGEPEREAWSKALRVFQAGSRHRPPRKKLAIGIILALSLGGYAAYAPMRLHFLADWQTQTQPEEIMLASGDRVHLDASSAVADRTEGTVREVTLLEGAGFFDVETATAPFVVHAGPLTTTVLGTAFEVSHLDDTVQVAVFEGDVSVTFDDREWNLTAGDRVLWDGDVGVVADRVQPENIAIWRTDRFVTDGMTFAQVVDVIDRRTPTNVIVIGKDLAASQMAGALDLSEPEVALQVLSGARNAQVFSIPLVGTVIRSAN